MVRRSPNRDATTREFLIASGLSDSILTTSLLTKEEMALPSVVHQSAYTEADIYEQAIDAHNEMMVWLDGGGAFERKLGLKHYHQRDCLEPKIDFDEFDSFLITTPMKSEARAREKVESDYKGDWSRLLDVVRATIAVRTLGDVDRIVQGLRVSGMRLVRVKNRFEKPDRHGYRDLHLNVAYSNGHIGEIQIHVIPMLKAREKMYENYKNFRGVGATVKNEGRTEYTPEEKQKVDTASAAMIEEYGKAWAKANGVVKTSMRRMAKLTDEQIEQVARKVLKNMQGPDDGTIILLDEGGEQKAPEGKQKPLKKKEHPEGDENHAGDNHKEEKPISMSDPTREARIAFRMTALDFDTRKEYQDYKKNHKIEPGTQVHILEDDPQVKLQDEDGKPKAPAQKDDASKDKGDKPDKPDDKQLAKPEDKGDKLKGQIEKAVGKDDAPNWKSHALHPSQITEHTKVQFPDGSSKKFKDLNDEEKARVQKAIAEKKIAHKGMNDYTKVDKDTLASNMKNNLARNDEGTEETKNDSPNPITKESVKKFAGSMRKNAESVLTRYGGALSDISRDMLLGSTDKDGKKTPGYLDHLTSAVEEAFTDGSMSGVSEASMDEFCREEMKRMVHQEIESRRRSLGDHGVRHLASNADNTMKMLGQLNDAGIKVSGKDKLMGLSIQANHDMGYTLGVEATSFSGDHRVTGGQVAGEESGRYVKIFGEKDAKKMQDIITTHDKPEIDWEKEPLQSSVRLADNMSLFGKDKVQDLFIRSPRAMEQVCKLKLAASIEPPEPKKPKKDDKKFVGKPDEYTKAVDKYTADMEEYRSPEVQAQVKKAKKIQDSVKKELHKIVDSDSEGYHENDRELLHRQVDEISSDFTTTDILSRVSGRIEGMSFDKQSKTMTVNMRYTPEGEIADEMFGEKVSRKQFGKFAEGMDMKPDPKNKDKMNLGGKPPSVTLNVEGKSDQRGSATTDAMRRFMDSTARMTFSNARNADTPEQAMEMLKKDRKKFSDKEWSDVEGAYRNMEYMSDGFDGFKKRLAVWPMLESEEAYIGTATASSRGGTGMSVQNLIMASVATMSVYRRLAKLSDDEKKEVIDKVKEKMNLKDEDEPKAETPEGDSPEGEQHPEMAPVDEDEDQKPTEETPAEGEQHPEMAPIDEMDEDQKPAEGEVPTEEAPVPADDQTPVDEVPVEDDDNDIPPDEPREDNDEDSTGDGESTTDDEDEEIEDKKDEIADIVSDLVEEVETIKSDGHVKPGEVLGLITQMMEMVNLLVEAKAPPRRKKKSSVREFIIAEKVAKGLK